MSIKKGIFLSLALSCSVAQASLVWTPAPADASAQKGGHHGHGGGTPFVLQDGEGAEAEIWFPTRVRRPLHVEEGGQVSVSGTGVSGYHMLYAIKSTADREEVAMRYLSQHGKPSGESPAKLVNARKSVLDITPAPLTREHQRYLSQKPFRFIVRFNGEALDGQKVSLTTSNGSRIESTTDQQGRVIFPLPDDFSEIEPGRRNNRPADFVLAVEHRSEGRAYRTTLSAPYYVNPSHWQSTAGGLLAMFAGVVTGLVVLRRNRPAKSVDAKGRA